MIAGPGQRVLFLLFIVLLFSGWLASAQDSAGSVSGFILCGDDNTPARGAAVSLLPMNGVLDQTPRGDLSTRTDFKGAYEFASVKPGTYLVHATMDGYGDDTQLALRSLGTASVEEKKKIVTALPQVIVKSGADSRKDVILHRAAAISGRVSVDSGGTAGRIRVTATRISDEHASARDGEPFELSGTVDDRGVYRIAGLPEGKYRLSIRITEVFLSAKPDKTSNSGIRLQADRPGTADLAVYAPDALDKASARIVEVKDADEISDADITVPTRLLHSIGGTVMENGVPAAGVSVSVQRRGGSVPGYDAVTLQDGSYRFDLLPSGSYTVRAKPMGSSTTVSGNTSVVLQDSDIEDANIELHPAVRE
jgi:hypothetical protein